MVKRRQILKFHFDNDISLIGISCHLKSYRLSFAMDSSLGLAFHRVNDFEVPGPGNEMIGYPFMIYEDRDLKNQYCLVQNHHPQGKLVPALRQVDFFLMARDPMEEARINTMVSKIRSIPQVLAVYVIDTTRTKGVDMLLQEMELHLMTAGHA
jgi:hypothetical protein